MTFRIEKDSLGEVEIPSEALWGPQTERSRHNFQIGDKLMPIDVIYGMVEIKRAAALVNYKEGKLPVDKKDAIVAACDMLLSGEFDGEFPLRVYQTGSGTQTNMNVNEVIARLCVLNGVTVHPNDDVNMSQSSNDTFPTAMHIASYKKITESLIPEMTQWVSQLALIESKYHDVFKIGRTHLQDATPLTFAQEVSGWRVMIEKSQQFIHESSQSLRYLTIGGTAVGTGLNASKTFDTAMVTEISENTGLPFLVEANKFYGLTSHSAISFTHGALRALAGDLMKIANDIRWLASGPRAGFNEITIPSNEPGSSIMPGKVNPTQAEALTMVSCQVMGNDTTIQVASSQGNFELNVFKPVIISNFLESISLIEAGMVSFREKCLDGLYPNEDIMEKGLNDSLMLVTALSPHIGYEKSAEVAKYAFNNNQTLKEAVLELGYATSGNFDLWVSPKDMI
ncbi:class II fumarate hydratase [Vagococcus jeotgali]|uniref:class II fumarate hydratase n=1 Tax=Vagococcus jeotgali TaxID=3109030 RepID=UPI002DD83EE9|nr:class II fumarate hydratase [Vagococcus sp. B2T-5]